MSRPGLADLEVGDIVEIRADYGPCSGGPAHITRVTRWDIWCGDQRFDRRTGVAKSPPWAYSLHRASAETKERYHRMFRKSG